MKKTLYSLMIAGVALGVTVNPLHAADNKAERKADRSLKAENKSNKGDLEDLTHSVNKAADKSGNMESALRAISVETGVPMERVRDMHKRHPEAGVGGILNACVMADETKVDPEDFFKEHLQGKNWNAIATQHNVSTQKLMERLQRVENYTKTGDIHTEKQHK